MKTPLFLFIASYLLTNIHFGNTSNGLGMIVGASGSYIEIGLYENEIATSWKIEAYNDEGYYSESISINGIISKISIEPVKGDEFIFKSNFDGVIEQKEISKSNRNREIIKGRRKFKKIINNGFPNLSYNSRKVIQKSKNSTVKIVFLKDGDILFEEKKNGSKEKYRINLFKY